MGGIVDSVVGFAGDILGFDTEAPDYSSVANASVEAARISRDLGEKQIDEARRQFDINRQVTDRVVEAQLGLMDQTREQGDDYFNYMKSFRPLEQQMLSDVSEDTSQQDALTRAQITNQAKNQADELIARARDFEGKSLSDIDLATGGSAGILARYGIDINRDVDRAVADARTGQTQALNTAARQAARYGISMPANMDAITMQNASMLASAANNAREGAINNYRNLAMQGIGLKRDNFITSTSAMTDGFNRANNALSTDRSMKIQDKSIDLARKLDVAGIARGLPGASQGAYGLSVSAGNSASQNQTTPSTQFLNAMQGGIGTIQTGLGQQISGLTGVLSNQTQARAQNMEVLGALIGAGGAAASSSDERLKTNVVLVGKDAATGLNLYEFAYISDPERRYVGVMAQEVQQVRPEAVVEDKFGYLAVRYDMLGLRMTEVI